MHKLTIPANLHDADLHDDSAWQPLASQWDLRADTIYLNHGSFGPAPRVVREAQLKWIAAMQAQPMDFLVRILPEAIEHARRALGKLLGTAGENIVPVDNATYGMNVVASSTKLSPGDEVLLTDHEYGAVSRIWERACKTACAAVKTAVLPLPIKSAAGLCDALFAQVTPRTKLIVVSHITSATAVIFPVVEICRRAKALGVPVCIDGPHAIAQVEIDLDALDCDWYAASCHKWLSAPLGAGFLYVNQRQQAHVHAPILSWGRPPEGRVWRWDDEFLWEGTRDMTPFLTIPTAIEFLEQVGLESFRARTHALAQYARQKLLSLSLADEEPIVPDSQQWYGTMGHLPLPAGDAPALMKQLWSQFGIEVPIIDFAGRRWIRVSCHLYTTRKQIDTLAEALVKLLRG